MLQIVKFYRHLFLGEIELFFIIINHRFEALGFLVQSFVGASIKGGDEGPKGFSEVTLEVFEGILVWFVGFSRLFPKSFEDSLGSLHYSFNYFFNC